MSKVVSNSGFKLETDALAAAAPAAKQANSTATTVAGIVSDFNDLLAKLIAAGLMKGE